MPYVRFLIVVMLLCCFGCVNSVETLTPPGTIVQQPAQDNGKPAQKALPEQRKAE